MITGVERTLNALWMVLKPHFNYRVCTTHFTERVESTLALLSVLHTLLYLVVNAHLHHEVCTDHYLYSGQCTPAL